MRRESDEFGVNPANPARIRRIHDESDEFAVNPTDSRRIRRIR
jgi:hypothetical protein